MRVLALTVLALQVGSTLVSAHFVAHGLVVGIVATTFYWS